jgi:hypothetical protein
MSARREENPAAPARAGGPSPDEVALLEEIERQGAGKVALERIHERVAVRAKVILRPGNASQARELKLQGVTGDLSQGGCRALFPVPVLVGDIYRLEFDIAWLESPIIFARCLRCRMVREDVFETGFEFFNAIPLDPARPRAGAKDLLD